ncbi:response regulator [Lacrimispora sp. JR3]|uniref:response regulator n=1 Tax=Lacrimispora sinapis TaxID=3111456 RepID=UPI003749E8F1
MYRVLIADDDILMQEALKILISREESFQVVRVVGSGDCAVKACREDAIDIVFMDMLMPGITGLEAGRIIHQMNPQITIYMLSSFSSHVFLRSMARDEVKDVLEKPVTWAKVKKILENYKTNHEDAVMDHEEALAMLLRNKDFGRFYRELPEIIDRIYEMAGGDSVRLIKLFHYIGQNLLDTRNVYDEKMQIGELFPINKALILDQKTSELWLFRVMDYLFQQNSINRYPLLENIFYYIENHIKEDITLNTIIENCAISQGYLSRIFREQLNVSVTEYIHMKKIHLAKGYFYFTEDSIADVAFRLGYNESSYFSKVFKKYEKITVKQYKMESRRKGSQ